MQFLKFAILFTTAFFISAFGFSSGDCPSHSSRYEACERYARVSVVLLVLYSFDNDLLF